MKTEFRASRINFQRSLTTIRSSKRNIKKLSEYIPKEYNPENLWAEYQTQKVSVKETEKEKSDFKKRKKELAESTIMLAYTQKHMSLA